MPRSSETDQGPNHHHDPDPQIRPADARTCERAAALFSALGEASRLRILSLLPRQELCVSQIVAALGDNLPAVSNRLRLLRNAGLVVSRREGKHIFYSLADRHVEELLTNGMNHASEAWSSTSKQGDLP